VVTGAHSVGVSIGARYMELVLCHSDIAICLVTVLHSWTTSSEALHVFRL